MKKDHCTGVLLVGHFYNYGGYSEYAHQIFKSMKNIDIPIRVLPIGDIKTEVYNEFNKVYEEYKDTSLGNSPYLLIIDIPPNFNYFEKNLFAKCIGVTIFETNSLPSDWVHCCNQMDEIWVPSQFNINTFIKAGVKKFLLKKLPLAILDENVPIKRKLKYKKKIKIIFSGALHIRKGIDLLINSYLSEFSPKENIELDIHTFPIKSGGLFKKIKNDIDLLRYSFPTYNYTNKYNFPKINVDLNYKSEKDYLNLLRQADGFVSFERANGWNYPLMQMIYMKKPTLSIKWGGSTEYLTDKNSLFIKPKQLIKTDINISNLNRWYKNQYWPSVDKTELQKGLRLLFNEIKKPNILNSLDIESLNLKKKFSISSMTARIKKKINFSKHEINKFKNEKEEFNRLNKIKPINHYEIFYNVLKNFVKKNTKFKITLVCNNNIIDFLLKKKILDYYDINLLTNYPQDCVGKIIVFDESQQIKISKHNDNFFYDLFEKNIIKVDPNQIERLNVLIFSGNLTKELNNSIKINGLNKIDCIFLSDNKIPPEISDNFIIINKENILRKNIYRFIICEEETSISRHTYQLLETLNSHSKISFLYPPTSASIAEASNKDIFNKSRFRRSSIAHTSDIKEFVCIPEFLSIKQKNEILLRINFSLRNRKCKVSYKDNFLNFKNKKCLENSKNRNEEIYGKLNNFQKNINFYKVKDLDECLLRKDNCIIVWDLKQLTSEQRKILSNCNDIVLIDQNVSNMRSGYNLSSLNYYSSSKKKINKLRKVSKKNFLNFYKKIKNSKKKKICIVGTGPSSENAFKTNFLDFNTIICNTIVKNKTLLKIINPAAIVAADADLHFGPSKYAQKFRQDTINAIKKFKCYLICPEAHIQIILNEIPKSLHKMVIGIPVDGRALNINLNKEFRLAAVDNVLCQFLLPISLFLSDEIYMIGFDGRKPDDKKFWSHNESNQYYDLYDTLILSHPAFFHFRSYDLYSETHNNNINNLFKLADLNNKKIYSITKSNIPEINSKYINEKKTIVKNIHINQQISTKQNKKILIIGNGPSTKLLIKKGLLNLPKYIDTMGLTLSFRYFELNNFNPNIYLCSDKKVVHFHKEYFKRLLSDNDIKTRFYFPIKISNNHSLIDHAPSDYSAIKLALDLDYEQILLIGIDLNYIDLIHESRILTKDEFTKYGFDKLNLNVNNDKLLIIEKQPVHNPNYFYSWYQCKGDIYSLPNSKSHTDWISKILKHKKYSYNKVINLSNISKLDLFKKGKLKDYLN
jgi:hypothetical protein